VRRATSQLFQIRAIQRAIAGAGSVARPRSALSLGRPKPMDIGYRLRAN
jgi:hypothetical protein